jgi:hypothetical protein
MTDGNQNSTIDVVTQFLGAEGHQISRLCAKGGSNDLAMYASLRSMTADSSGPGGRKSYDVRSVSCGSESTTTRTLLPLMAPCSHSANERNQAKRSVVIRLTAISVHESLNGCKSTLCRPISFAHPPLPRLSLSEGLCGKEFSREETRGLLWLCKASTGRIGIPSSQALATSSRCSINDGLSPGWPGGSG